MFCCTGWFSHLDDDPPAALPAPRRCQKKHSRRNQNCFSTRGLDKFSTVMTELKAKREQILAMAGSPAPVVVLFMYDNSRDWIPIIVRSPEPTTKKSNTKKPQLSPPPPPPSPERATNDVVRRVEKVTEGKLEESLTEGKLKKISSRAAKERGRESLYWGGVMMVILFCLVIFGRIFAICCTTIWWYRVPTTMEGNDELKMQSRKMKKEYTRRKSNKRMSNGSASSSLSRKAELRGDDELKMQSMKMKKEYTKRMSDKGMSDGSASSSLPKKPELGDDSELKMLSMKTKKEYTRIMSDGSTTSSLPKKTNIGR